MAGIYIHIPFCKQACNYCNFHFTTSLRYKNELVTALLKEIELRKNYLQGETIETIYFGGGTPSLLSVEDCQLLIDKCKNSFTVNSLDLKSKALNVLILAERRRVLLHEEKKGNFKVENVRLQPMDGSN